MAGQFGCDKVVAISDAITNRYLMLMGDYFEEEEEARQSQCKE